MGLIDSHCHLTYEPLSSDLPGVLRRAAEAGVEKMITIGTDMEDAARAIALAEKHDAVLTAVGIHPHQAGKVAPDDWSTYERLLNHPRVVAAGEMGLDYHYDFAERSVQRDVFARQLELARAADKAVIIHCREAFEDTLSVLRDHDYRGRRVVFHCFGGTQAEADQLHENGWRASFTGIVTFKKSTDLHELVAHYPLDELMFETDSPYLSPEPVRHKKPNEPAHLRHTAEFVAKLRNTPLPELSDLTSRNTRTFFSIPSSE